MKPNSIIYNECLFHKLFSYLWWRLLAWSKCFYRTVLTQVQNKDTEKSLQCVRFCAVSYHLKKAEWLFSIETLWFMQPNKIKDIILNISNEWILLLFDDEQDNNETNEVNSKTQSVIIVMTDKFGSLLLKRLATSWTEEF